MLARETDFGHSAAQAPVLVQLPKPNSSIFATIAFARRAASTLPCGKRANWLTLADTKSIAEPFLQAAAQAARGGQPAKATNAKSEILKYVTFFEQPLNCC